MTRQEAYAAVDAERDRQDAQWPRNIEENPQRAQYMFYSAHLLLLEEKISRLRALWYASEREQLHAELVKIAAISVRALEEVR